MLNSTLLADIVKGVANRHRIDVLDLVACEPNLTVDSIAERLKVNYKTIAVHIARLHKSGLVSKKYRGAFVQHTITPRGNIILKFLRILE